MLGADAEENELGNLVGVGSAVYQGSKAQKAGKLGEQDARFDKLLSRRSKNVSDLYAAGDVKGGKKAQQALESMEAKYNTNRKDAEGKGWGGSMLGMSDEDMNIQPTAMTQEEMDAKRRMLDGGTSGGGRGTSTGRGGMPPTADAPTAPDASLPGHMGGAKPLQTPISAAQKYATSGASPTILSQQKQEKDDLIARIGAIKPQGGQEVDKEMLEKGGKRYRDDMDFTGDYGISEAKRKALRLQGYGA